MTGRLSPVTPIPTFIMYTKQPTPHKVTSERRPTTAYHRFVAGRLDRESSR